MEKDFGQLYSFLTPSPFRGGEKTLLRGKFAHKFIYDLIAKRLANNKKETIMIDGCNSLKPYKVVNEAKKREDLGIIDRTKVCRGFTAYQIFEIICERLDDFIKPCTELVIGLEPTYLFSDNCLEESEAVKLLKTAFNDFLFDKKPDLNLILLNNTFKFKKLLDNFTNQSILFEKTKKGIKVNWKDEILHFDPKVHFCQTILSDFVGPNKRKKSITFKRTQKELRDFMGV